MNQGRTKVEDLSTANELKPPPPQVILLLARPKAALLFWFFDDFRCGVVFIIVLCISQYPKNGQFLKSIFLKFLLSMYLLFPFFEVADVHISTY